MKLLDQKVYKASNLLARVPLIHIRICVEPDEAAVGETSALLIAKRLTELLPPVVPYAAADRRQAVPLFPEMRSYAPEAMVAYVALALQREFGFNVFLARSEETQSAGTCEAVFEHREETLGLAAGRLAARLVDAAWSEALRPNPSGARKPLSEILAEGLKNMNAVCLPDLTRWIIWEAERRNIPWSRIHTHPNQKMVELGQGHRLRRFQGSFTSDTSYVATMLATPKQGACELFRAQGIPVPRQVLVGNADSAVAAARRIGYPVVVKPNFADMQQGLFLDLKEDQSVRNAYEAARKFYGSVVVGEQVRGRDYRITLIHGRIVGASRRDVPPHVIGDGRSSVRDLIEVLNSDPRRGRQEHFPLRPITIDNTVRRTLEEQNLHLDSVPVQGASVRIHPEWRQFLNTYEDVTEIIHPDNRAMFERAARLIGLDLGGIDYISPDISRPWTEVGGVILEINPTPGFENHMRAGSPDILSIVYDMYFPPGENGRVPTAVIKGPVSVARAVADILNVEGQEVGLATDAGIEIDGSMVARGAFSGPARSEMVLRDPLTEAAVLQFAVDDTFNEGLGLDEIAVGAVTTVTARDGGSVDTVLDKREKFAALIVETARDLVVLNADDQTCFSLAKQCQAKRLCWVAVDSGAPMVSDHIAQGGLAIAPVVRDSGTSICLWDGDEQVQLVTNAHACPDVVDAMFAGAIAYGLGASPMSIAEVLERITRGSAGKQAD